MIYTQEEEFKRLPKETIVDYCHRIASLREDYDLTWDEVAEIINGNTGLNYTESKYRKAEKRYLASLRLQEEAQEEDCCDGFDSKIAELKMLKVQVSDERVQANALYRTMAREETLKEIAANLAEKIGSKSFLAPTKLTNFAPKSKSAILCLSDIHYGLTIDLFCNQYDTDIARQRIQKLQDKVVEYINFNKISDLYVVNLGDLISGRIHTTIRINNKIDVITQTMEMSRILADFLQDLSAYTTIHYTSTSDNHSRLEPIKSESLDKENLQRMIDFHIQYACKDYVDFIDNQFGDDIATFDIGKFKIVATHGDKDTPANAIQHLSLMTNNHYDLCLIAHRHHMSMDENCGTLLIANGSICGTDDFAQKLRVHSNPSQNLIILGENSAVECIYKIDLN